MPNVDIVLEAAYRLAKALRAADESIDLYPVTGDADSEEGRAHWSNVCRERDAAIAAVVAAVATPDIVECDACKGTGRVKSSPVHVQSKEDT